MALPDHHRRVLALGVGLAAVEHPLGAGFCIDCWEEALRVQGRAEIFNSNQGVPSTSLAFTRVLREAVIAISKEGRGRALDNVFVERLWRTVKYEDIDPKGYASMAELHMWLTDYLTFYHEERPHPALNNRTPKEIHRGGQGGGAVIADRFKDVREITEVVVVAAGETSVGHDRGSANPLPSRRAGLLLFRLKLSLKWDPPQANEIGPKGGAHAHTDSSPGG